MLIFYYGLPFLATLSITDGVATFILIALIDFFIGKTIWQDYEPFVTWRKKKYEQLIKLKKSAKKPLLKKWKKASLLKRAYIIIAGVVGFALSILFIRLYLEVLWISWDDIGEDDKIRNLAIAFVGTITGIGALFGVYLAILRSEENTRQNKIANDQNKIAKSQADTAIRQSDTAIEQSKAAIKQNEIANDQNEIANEQNKIANEQREIANKQANTAEQGLISDRINKAVENLGKNENGTPVLEIRIGAIYALERIAKDSERDHVQIMEIFCTYIRTNSSNNDKDIITKPLREDIKIILDIITRRHRWEQGKNRIQIEKNQGMNLNFFNCYLKNTELQYANLSGANFYKANLEGAWLNGINLSRARLIDVKINDAILTDAKTTGACAWTGDFSGCETLNQKQIDQMFLGKEVVLPEGLIHPQKDSKYDKVYNNEDDFEEARREWRKETGN